MLLLAETDGCSLSERPLFTEIDNKGGERRFFICLFSFLRFTSLFYYYYYYSKDSTAGKGKNEIEVNSKSNCFILFSFLFLSSISSALFVCVISLCSARDLLLPPLLKCFIFFTLSWVWGSLQPPFHSNDFDYMFFFSSFFLHWNRFPFAAFSCSIYLHIKRALT